MPDEATAKSVDWLTLADQQRFDVLEQLGEGGVATVYKAFDRQSDRPVALKVLHRSSLQLEAIQRFSQESAILTRLEHRAVVRVYGTGVTTNESPFLVLEFVPGGTLRDLLEERPGEALPTHHAVQIIGEIGEGLAAAHRVGVVHRDVKPENVLIGQNSAKLVDFGMAKVLGKEAPEITFGSKICGTPQYMPPERAQGRPVTSAADVYSLGVIAYELLTGQLPFNFKSPVEVMTAHITKDPPPMPEVNEELEQVIRSAMLKIPQMRPSAMGFVGALRRTARTAHQG